MKTNPPGDGTYTQQEPRAYLMEGVATQSQPELQPLSDTYTPWYLLPLPGPHCTAGWTGVMRVKFLQASSWAPLGQ